jgi:hypothetical protein
MVKCEIIAYKLTLGDIPTIVMLIRIQSNLTSDSPRDKVSHLGIVTVNMECTFRDKFHAGLL